MTMTHEKLSLMVEWSSSVSISCFRAQSSICHLVWLSNNFLEGTWGVFILWKHVLREAVPHTFFRKTSQILNPLRLRETPLNPLKPIWNPLKYSWTSAWDNQFENTSGHSHTTVNLKIYLDTCVRQIIWKYSLTPPCDSQFQNTPWYPRATVNKKILLDNRMHQSIWKYSWTTACDSQLENTPEHPRATVN